jgi:stage V sporulation protein B
MNPQKNFVKGAAILSSTGFIAKIFGMVYTIVTTNVLQSIGMAPYMAAFPVYTFLLALSSAGLPVAISKMVSERIALGDYYAANLVFRKALKAMMLIGLITSALMIALSTPISLILNIPHSNLTIMGIAPSLFFVAVMSTYRGYFQGMMRMTPTAVSQIIEQVVKLIVGLALMYLLIGYGSEYGALGAILGITISEVASLGFLIVLYNKRKAGIKADIWRSTFTRLRHGIGKKMFYLALPIIVGSCAMPLVQLADSAIITNTLMGMKTIVLFGKEIVVDSSVIGLEAAHKIVDSLYGLTSYINPIVNLPAVFSMALAMSLVPAISASKASRDPAGVSSKAGMGFKLSLLIAIPCGVGLYLFSEPIIRLLYTVKDPLELGLFAETGKLLSIMGISVFFLTILQTMTGILQGLGKTYLPVINLFIGIAAKIVVSIVTIRIPEINIQGAFYGTAVCYFIAALLDVICVIKETKANISFVNTILKPLLAGAALGVFLFFAGPLIAHFSANGIIFRILTIGAVGVAAMLYFFFMFLFGAVTREDMKFFPGGRRLTSLAVKTRIWKP